MAQLFPRELSFLASAAARQRSGLASGLRHELVTAPLVTLSAMARCVNDFPQRGLLGLGGEDAAERVYFNSNTPSSGVVCGVQVRLCLASPLVACNFCCQEKVTQCPVYLRTLCCRTSGLTTCHNPSQRSCSSSGALSCSEHISC